MKVRHVLAGVVILGGAFLGTACTTGGDETAFETGPGLITSDSTQGDETTPDETTPDGSAAAAASDDPYVQELAALMRQGSEAGEGYQYTEDQIECFAPRVVAIYGTDRLEAEGITPDELEPSGMGFLGVVIDEDEAHAVWDSYDACDIDIAAVFIEAMAGSDGSDAMRQCLTDRLTESFLRDAFVMEMTTEYDEDARDDPSGLGRTLMFCGQQ